MSLLEPASVACPYCGEILDLGIDRSAGPQSYVEDCQVCCRPIVVDVAIDESGAPRVAVRREDE